MSASHFEGNGYICEYINFAMNAKWEKKLLLDHFMCFLLCIFKSVVPYAA